MINPEIKSILDRVPTDGWEFGGFGIRRWRTVRYLKFCECPLTSVYNSEKQGDTLLPVGEFAVAGRRCGLSSRSIRLIALAADDYIQEKDPAYNEVMEIRQYMLERLFAPTRPTPNEHLGATEKEER